MGPALLACAASVLAYHAGETVHRSVLDPELVSGFLSAPQPTVAWLTERDCDGDISYVETDVADVQFAAQEEAEAPASSAASLVCASVNTAMSSDENCKVMCERQMSNATNAAAAVGEAAAQLRVAQGAQNLCDPDYCTCYDPSVPHEALVKKVKTAARKQPSGLPDCQWVAPAGCDSNAPYECMEGESAGQCSAQNWYGRPDECKSSCIHANVFFFSPRGPSGTIEEWVPGPVLEPAAEGAEEEVPHYEHDACKLTLEKRGIDIKSLDVMMTSACKKHTEFVGVSFFSPTYKTKAERLLKSCTRHNICCKATQSLTSFGPDKLEGSEEFRFEFIASKPAFILEQIEMTKRPVVWLDVDLEFHDFPELFMPGGWKDGPRDVAIFNYWGNETSGNDVPSVGSGVVYFNSTKRAKNVLVAWAEAMAFDTNPRAPDDQVLNDLLGQGSWVKRASFGWLPASYLRVQPMFYRGVVPVIDHDHGNPTGLIEHSSEKAKMPPPGEGAAPVEWKDGVPHPGKCKKPPTAAAAEDQPSDDSECGPLGCNAPTQGQAGGAAPPTQEAAAEALPKAALTCTATSPQANDEWCNGACNENPEDGGCTGFCDCSPAAVTQMQRVPWVGPQRLPMGKTLDR